MIYDKAINSICGITMVELLFYNNFVGDITTIGFQLNPYDSCVENVIQNQPTVCCVVYW